MNALPIHQLHDIYLLASTPSYLVREMKDIECFHLLSKMTEDQLVELANQYINTSNWVSICYAVAVILSARDRESKNLKALDGVLSWYPHIMSISE